MKKQYKVWMQTEHTSNSWFHSTEIEKHEFSSKKEAEKCYRNAVSDMKLSDEIVTGEIVWKKVLHTDVVKNGDVLAVGRNW